MLEILKKVMEYSLEVFWITVDRFTDGHCVPHNIEKKRKEKTLLDICRFKPVLVMHFGLPLFFIHGNNTNDTWHAYNTQREEIK